MTHDGRSDSDSSSSGTGFDVEAGGSDGTCVGRTGCSQHTVVTVQVLPPGPPTSPTLTILYPVSFPLSKVDIDLL